MKTSNTHRYTPIFNITEAGSDQIIALRVGRMTDILSAIRGDELAQGACNSLSGCEHLRCNT